MMIKKAAFLITFFSVVGRVEAGMPFTCNVQSEDGTLDMKFESTPIKGHGVDNIVQEDISYLGTIFGLSAESNLLNDDIRLRLSFDGNYTAAIGFLFVKAKGAKRGVYFECQN